MPIGLHRVRFEASPDHRHEHKHKHHRRIELKYSDWKKLQADREELRRSNCELREALDRAEYPRQTAERDLRVLRHEIIPALQERIRTLEAENIIERNNHRREEHERRQHRHHYDDDDMGDRGPRMRRRKSFEDLRAENRAAEEKIRRLKERGQELQDKRDHQAQRARAAERGLRDVTDVNQTLEKTIDEWAAKYRRLARGQRGLVERLDDAEARLGDLKRMNARLQDYVDQQERIIRDYENGFRPRRR